MLAVVQYTDGMCGLRKSALKGRNKKYKPFNCVEVRLISHHKTWLKLGGPGSQ
jgi:hypothetical protein